MFTDHEKSWVSGHSSIFILFFFNISLVIYNWAVKTLFNHLDGDSLIGGGNDARSLSC